MDRGGALGPSQLERPLQLVEDRPLVRVVAVELEAGIAEVDRVQASLDDLERRHLLGDEEHGLPAGERLAHEIRDRLRLPGPRRSLDDEVPAGHGVDDREGLGAVGIDDRTEADSAGMSVDLLAVADRRRTGPEPAATQQRPQDGMVARLLVLGPLVRVEVLVDEELAEREEGEVDRVGVHRPARLVLDGPGHGPEVGFHLKALLGEQFGQPDFEVGPEPRREGEVRLDLVSGPPEPEGLADVGPVEPHGDEDERRRAVELALLGLAPSEESEREVEGVDPLLLDRGARLAEGLAEPPGESRGVLFGLQLVVDLVVGRGAGTGLGGGQKAEQLRRDLPIPGVAGCVRGRIGRR